MYPLWGNTLATYRRFPFFTSCFSGFRGSLVAIWFNRNHISLTALLHCDSQMGPTQNQIKRQVLLPDEPQNFPQISLGASELLWWGSWLKVKYYLFYGADCLLYLLFLNFNCCNVLWLMSTESQKKKFLPGGQILVILILIPGVSLSILIAKRRLLSYYKRDPCLFIYTWISMGNYP